MLFPRWSLALTPFWVPDQADSNFWILIQVKALALPTEAEMTAKDKYTTFSRTDPGYRKSLHKVPHWTRLTHRTNPTGF